MRLKPIDLSHVIKPGMPLFSDTAPPPKVSAYQSHQKARQSGRYEGCSCEISRVDFVTSIGTYMDSPFHFHPNGPSIEALDIESCVLPALVVDCTHIAPGEAIGPEVIKGRDVAGKAVLFNTGMDRLWGEGAYLNSPFLTSAAARALIQGGARLAGVDFLVIDDLKDPRRPVHVSLLAEGILIVENLCRLEKLPQDGFFFSAAPVKLKGAAAFPVRAHALLPGDLIT